ncbi:hypothetical protein QBC47DRAFT_366589 [Echria macrotheca]|uniref:BHLH domain-containing protein n=1 Tax=Echria macrotheca TaxID=438768 RepID=A0AAJ0BMY1_9PEZI|nr:hypothetical protein QBC47DRAFT_366589 [Echria macrotheca]
MDSQDNNSWSAAWWNDTDVVSVFDRSLDNTLDGFCNLGETCFYLPPAIDSSDSDYSLGTCASPVELCQDGDDASPWFTLPQASIGTAGALHDTPSPETWGCSSPPELHHDSVATDGDSCSSPASNTSGKTALKRLRSSGGVKKAKAKPRKESVDSDRMSRHNLVEKKYRNRLNQQFELMIATLAEVGEGDVDGDKDRTLSKSTVLQLARQTMLNLERKNQLLAREVDRLSKEKRMSLAGQRPQFLL